MAILSKASSVLISALAVLMLLGVGSNLNAADVQEEAQPIAQPDYGAVKSRYKKLINIYLCRKPKNCKNDNCYLDTCDPKNEREYSYFSHSRIPRAKHAIKLIDETNFGDKESLRHLIHDLYAHYETIGDSGSELSKLFEQCLLDLVDANQQERNEAYNRDNSFWRRINLFSSKKSDFVFNLIKVKIASKNIILDDNLVMALMQLDKHERSFFSDITVADFDNSFRDITVARKGLQKASEDLALMRIMHETSIENSNKQVTFSFEQASAFQKNATKAEAEKVAAENAAKKAEADKVAAKNAATKAIKTKVAVESATKLKARLANAVGQRRDKQSRFNEAKRRAAEASEILAARRNEDEVRALKMENARLKAVQDEHFRLLQSKLGREAASKEAADMLQGKTVLEYCQSLDKNADYDQLRKIAQLQKFAAENQNQFCAEKLAELRKNKLDKCQDQVISVCMDKSAYADKYLWTLNSLISDGEKRYEIGDLVSYLDDNFADAKKKGIWGVDSVALKNTAKSPWLVASPRYSDANRTDYNIDTHSENLLDAWAGTIASATKFVDVTTLSPPEGKFKEALKASLSKLHSKSELSGEPIYVRIMVGANGYFQNFKLVDLLEDLTEGLENTKLKISVGTYDASGNLNSLYWKRVVVSWNHSKIVAVDGNMMFTGGHNLYNTYTEANNPVHDLSVLIPGKLAQIGHQFANNLWDYASTNKNSWGISKYFGEIEKNYDENVPNFIDNNHTIQPTKFDWENRVKKEQVIAIGRLASAGSCTTNKYNPSDKAIVKMMENAKKALYISQQALMPLYFLGETPHTTNVLDALTDALLRGVDVYILKSSTIPEVVGVGNTGYSSGYTNEATFKYLYDRALLRAKSSDGVETLLFDHLHVLDTANMKREVPNHAKVVIADDNTAYIGSHNLYDDSHAEFGVIVGKTASRELLTDYFSPLWHASLATQPPMKELELHEYEVGNYVYVRRGGSDDVASQDWTLGVVTQKEDKHIIRVLLDVLGSDAGRVKWIDNKSHLVLAPGGVRALVKDPTGGGSRPVDMNETQIHF